MQKRLLALLLALAMLLSMTTGAFAENAQPVEAAVELEQAAPAEQQESVPAEESAPAEEPAQEEPVQQEPAQQPEQEEPAPAEEPAQQEPAQAEAADAQAAQAVAGMIAAIGEVTPESAAAINAAAQAYEALTPAQKQLVPNYGVLADALAKLLEMTAPAEAERVYPIAGECGNGLAWSLDENGTLTISGKGEMESYAAENSQPWASYAREIRAVVVERDVTAIGSAAFYGAYENLKQVSLPDTLARIGEQAFEGCVALEELELPATVVEIGANAFKNCIGLKRAGFAGDVQALAIGEGNELLAAMLAVPVQEADAVENVIGLIDAIGEVTLESESAIAAAQAAYEALSDEEKARVSNYGALEAAMAAFMALSGNVMLAEETAPAADAKVYVTINNAGHLAMVNGEVTVTDINADGVLTYDEALQAAHNKYCAGGYEAEDRSSGLFVTKLWGVANGGSYYFYKNGVPLSEGVGSTESSVAAGDHLYASVLKDTTSYSDICGKFNQSSLTATAGEAFTLTLSGVQNDIWTGNTTDISAISGVQLGIWESGAFTAIDGATTDESGKASITLSRNGTYIITAEGSMGTAPIMPPVCVVTVEGGEPVRHYLSDLRFKYANVSDDKLHVALQEDVYEYTVELPANLGLTGVAVGALLSEYAPENSTITAVYKTNGTGKERTVKISSSDTQNTEVKFLIAAGPAETVISIKVGTDSDEQTYTLNVIRTPAMLLSAVQNADGVALPLKDGLYYAAEDCEAVQIKVNSYKLPLTINGQTAENNKAFTLPLEWSTDDTFTVEICVSANNQTCTQTLTIKKLSKEDEFSGNCDANIAWSLKNGVLSINGSGAMPNYTTAAPAPWSSFRSIIEKIDVGDGITAIGNYAFYQTTWMQEVRLPAGLESIGEYAFAECSKLGNVTLPEGLTTLGSNAFASTGIKNVVIPASVEKLDGSTFMYCKALESATINGNMCSHMFYGCTALKNVTFNGTGLTEIPVYAFNNCTALEEIEIPEGVVSIGLSEFWTPAKISLPSTLETLDARALGYGVTELTINNNDRFVKRDGIVYSADGTTLLLCEKDVAGEVAVQDGVTTIASYAFAYCDQITGIRMPATLRTIREYAFINCARLVSASLQEGLTNIEDGAFAATGLEEIKLPETLTQLGARAFGSCAALKTLEIPSGITVLQSGVLNRCESLESIVLPASLTTIGNNAFTSYTPALKTVYYRGGVDDWNAITGEGKPADGSYEIVYYYGRNDVATITAQPQDCMLAQNSTAENALSVTVAAPTEGDGKLSYAWYVNDANSISGGAAVEGTVSEDGLTAYCAPSTAELGNKYYYCIITTTLGDGAELKAPSRAAKVQVVAYKWNGDGTAEAPYELATAQDLQALYDYVASGESAEGVHFRMTENITLPDGWQPIGITKDGSHDIKKGENLLPFSGDLDGNGKTLTVPEGGLPLLGYVKGAKVSNLNIYGKQIAGYGLVNYLEGVDLSGEAICIDNVTLKSGSSTLKSGLIGTYITNNIFAGCSAAFYVTIRNCTVESGVVVGYGKDESMIGSIAGRVHGTISNCTSGATVYGKNYVGGILGTRDNAVGTCEVSDCTFTGSVVASGEQVGGIVGGGYSNATAPNGGKIAISDCKSSGDISGADKVGGILGADVFVAQSWGGYELKNNSFTGKVSASSGSAAGGIVGYYLSMNKCDDISGNYYASGCGARGGIGFVKYIDTSCETHETGSGTNYFSTETDVSKCPDVNGCGWKTGYNRTDDPLGADAANLWYTDTIAVTGIALDRTALTLDVNGTATLAATVGPENASDRSVAWRSSDETVATVKDGLVTAVKVGTATITAKAGGFEASCEVTVAVLPKLSALTLRNGIQATRAEFALTPAFDPDVREYTITVPDTVTGVTGMGVWATLAEGGTGAITANYTSLLNNQALKVAVTSGKDMGAPLSGSVKSKELVGNTITIEIGDLEAYTVHVLRQPTLSALNFTLGEATLELNEKLDALTRNYSVLLPLNSDLTSITANAAALLDGVGLSYNGEASATIAPVWEHHAAQLNIKLSAEGAQDTLYTVQLNQTPAKLEVITAPKTEYATGDAFDPTGMVLQAIYADGGTETVPLDQITIEPDGPLTGSTVIIKYNGAQVELAITVGGGLKGSGTAEAPWLIETYQDFETVRDLVASGVSFEGEYLKMTEDIALPDGWTPIGVTKDGSNNIQSGANLLPFSGNLDCGGKTLTVPEGGLPLLGYVKGATVSNLNISGKKIAGYGLVNNLSGVGLSGLAIAIDHVTLKSGSSTLKSGLIGTELNSNPYAGCSAGFTVSISNCTVESGVVIGYNKDQSMIGSIAGRIQGTISNCTSAATVYGTNYVGGVIGTRDNALGTCKVTDCTFTGSVVASGDHVGGIVGGGYSDSTAPNGIKITVQNCSASGSVSGADKVGGILGGDTMVAQAWDPYSFTGNSFTGKVSGSSNVGGVIGYYRSLNKFDDVANNYYASGCGAKGGFGFVEYVDTNCETHETESGALYFNTETSTAGCPSVTGCDWKKAHNRTDDPLGADAAKLMRTDGTVVVDVTGLALDKAELDLKIDETATLTATVTPENATDKTVRWTSSNEAVATVFDGVVTAKAFGTATITATAGSVTAECSVKVTAEPAADITVYMTVSDRGVLATANDGAAMFNRSVEVSDINSDGVLTYDEALTAAHAAYCPGGYASAETEWGVSVSRLWGVDTMNCLFFLNDSALENDVGNRDTSALHAGDYLVASVNKDNTYYADHYVSFAKRTSTAIAGREFALCLNGGMGSDKISIGVWNAGKFTVVDGAKIDADGNVTLTFREAGSYLLTASGVISDTVQDWSAGASVTADCPIIAPGCWVKVDAASIDPDAKAEKLTISGSYKTTYAVGDKLDLKGMVLTVRYSDGSTREIAADDATVTGFDTETRGEKTVVLSYDGVSASFVITVTKAAGTIDVTLTLIGDSKHGSGKVHTLAKGGLTTWVKATTYNVKSGATVWAVLKQCLDEHGMKYSNPSGNYVASVNGLGEFDNGKNSGWMYTLNGKYPLLGVSEQKLKDGDRIVFHYTDDYTLENTGFDHGPDDGEDESVMVAAVKKLIENIGEVTLDDSCKAKIDAARKAYDKLTFAEKKQVDNYNKLQEAEKKYASLKQAEDQVKADAVIKLIDEMGDDKTKIKAARDAYDALTDAQKKLVTNYDKLTAAEYTQASSVATSGDRQSAQDVIDLIDAIGDRVDDNSAAKIDAARKAYDKLSDTQKALVTNYAALEAAEAAYERFAQLAEFENLYRETGDALEELGTPDVGSIGGEWMAVGLARSGREVDADGYYAKVLDYVNENIDENERLNPNKCTDNARLILALTALGRDVTDVDGHNLLAGLNEMAYIENQGVNGPIWALIALDSNNYDLPEGDVTRDALIECILDAQLEDGGWAFAGENADTDMTAMALTALAPYYAPDAEDESALNAAVEKGVECLAMLQFSNGGFGTYGPDGEMVATSESAAQVVVALTALNIDPETDERFIKNGSSALDALVAYGLPGGGFKHLKDGERDAMATEQGYYALTAYARYLMGLNRLYDMRDVFDENAEAIKPLELYIGIAAAA